MAENKNNGNNNQNQETPIPLKQQVPETNQRSYDQSNQVIRESTRPTQTTMSGKPEE